MQSTPNIEITGIDHFFISVSNLNTSMEFYDPIMRHLGFFKGTDPIDGEPHIHYFNQHLQLTLRPARVAREFDCYAPGLHHVCFRAQSKQEIENIAEHLEKLGVDYNGPSLHENYAPDYYSVFLTDPDGIIIEFVNFTVVRDFIQKNWHRFDRFENPISALPDNSG